MSLIEAHANTARRVKNVKNTINRFGDRLLYEAQVRRVPNPDLVGNSIGDRGFGLLTTDRAAES